MYQMKASLFRFGINLWPPFLFSGIHVTHVSDDYRYIRVELRQRRWNVNYVGTHFGGSLFAMTDPFWMLSLLQNIGRDHYVWDKRGDIDFIKPGRGVVSTEFRVDEALLDEIRTATASGQKYLCWFENDVVDANGDVVARVRKQVYVRLKPDARKPA
jgi:acyl-coenzyme A thioesterase PaaI-like protein